MKQHVHDHPRLDLARQAADCGGRQRQIGKRTRSHDLREQLMMHRHLCCHPFRARRRRTLFYRQDKILRCINNKIQRLAYPSDLRVRLDLFRLIKVRDVDAKHYLLGARGCLKAQILGGHLWVNASTLDALVEFMRRAPRLLVQSGP